MSERQLNIHDKINIRQLAKEFPEIGRKEMQERFKKLKIGATGELLDTMDFKGKVLVNGVMLEVTYLWYGKWTDLGLGRGMRGEDVTIRGLIGSGRKRKNWTRKLAHFRHRLGELYTEMAAQNVAENVADSYDRTLRFKL
jgi:hypothetical protein